MKTTRRQFVAASASMPLASQIIHAAPLTIFEAAAAGDIARAKEICKDSPDSVNLQSPEGRTPLHFAAAAGQVEMINQLVQLGADLSAGTESPMIPVANYSDSKIAADMALPLLSNGSNPDARTKDGVGALGLAAARGNREVARLLIHRGASLDPKDSIVSKAIPEAPRIDRVFFGQRYSWGLSGKTPARDDRRGLPQANINRFVTIAHFDAVAVKQMLKDTPDLLSTRSTWDELAIEAAAHMGLVSLAQYMADAGAPVSMCTAIMLGMTEVVRKMLAEDARRISERGAHDFTPLMYSSFGNEQADATQLLLNAGSDPNAFGLGQTALHVAAAKGHLRIAEMLIAKGADVNALIQHRAGAGTTPLASAHSRKQEKMVEFLASRGGRA